jgi:hypothetical protein
MVTRLRWAAEKSFTVEKAFLLELFESARQG